MESGIEDLRPPLEITDSALGVDGNDRKAGVYRDLAKSATGRAEEIGAIRLGPGAGYDLRSTCAFWGTDSLGVTGDVPCKSEPRRGLDWMGDC